MKESSHRRVTRVIGCAAALVAAAGLAGCAESGQFSGLAWFQNRDAPAAATVLVTLPDSPAGLGTEGLEGSLRNAIDLARQKRFAESRTLMAELAGSYPAGSDFWRVIKCAELTLAIRGNEPALLGAGAEAVERTLRDPLRPPRECVAQLAIARAAQGRPLPVNTPATLAEALRSVPREPVRALASDDSAGREPR